jgi:hypothetical protein
MALLTAGTSLTTTLNALVQNTDLTIADGALIRAAILWDGAYVNAAWTRIQAGAIYPGAYEFQGGSGLLHVPRRGTLKVLEGDYVAVDPNGWPILISGWSINGSGATGWTHS